MTAPFPCKRRVRSSAKKSGNSKTLCVFSREKLSFFFRKLRPRRKSQTVWSSAVWSTECVSSSHHKPVRTLRCRDCQLGVLSVPLRTGAHSHASWASCGSMERRARRASLTSEDRVEEAASVAFFNFTHLWALSSSPHLCADGEGMRTRPFKSSTSCLLWTQSECFHRRGDILLFCCPPDHSPSQVCPLHRDGRWIRSSSMRTVRTVCPRTRAAVGRARLLECPLRWPACWSSPSWWTSWETSSSSYLCTGTKNSGTQVRCRYNRRTTEKKGQWKLTCK